MRIHFCWISISLLAIVSCSTPEQIQNRKCARALHKYEVKAFKSGCPFSVFDSIVIQETRKIQRDTTIFVRIPGEIVHDSIWVAVADSITSQVSTLKTKYALSRAWIENRHLMHTLEQVKSDIQQVIQGINKETVTLKQKTIRVPYPVEKLVKHSLNKLEEFLLWSGCFAWGIIIALVIYKLTRILTFRNWFS